VSIGDAVGYGWTTYWKNVGPMLVIALIIAAVHVAFGVVGDEVDSLAGRILLQLAAWLIGLFLALGLFRVALEITRGVQPEIGDLFKSEGYAPYFVASILFGIGVFVGLLLFVVPGIIFAVVFGFYGFVAAERGNDVLALETLQRAAEISRGHRWQLFGLAIVLFLINVLGALLFVVGLLFTAGITIIAWAYTYRRLSGETVNYAAWDL
jgi:hypothetical protein